jgi:hypothetical protein
MKNDDPSQNAPNSEPDAASTPSPNKRNKKDNKANNKADKPNQRRKKSFREVWRSYSRVKQAEFIIGALVAAGAVGYLVAYIVESITQNAQIRAQHMPLVINIRPPEMLQTFICDPTAGLHTGNMQTAIKNIGTASAFHVMPFFNVPKIIPEKKTGQKFYDAPPEANCKLRPKANEIDSPLAPGREMSPQIRQMAGSIPPIGKNDPIQLYWVSCVYYSDEYGGTHGTCDTYRLMFPNSDNPLDALSGSPTFFCDATPKKGKFADTIGGHCQE